MCDFSLQLFSHKDHEDLFLVWPPKKAFRLYFLQTLGVIFWRQTKLGASFAQIFSDFVWIFSDFAQVFRDLAQIFTEFA